MSKSDFDTDIADYFRSNLVSTRKALSEKDWKSFKSSVSGSDKVALILSYPEPHELTFDIENPEVKNFEQCMAMKKKGNELFGQGAFEMAAKVYTSAVLLAPRDDVAVLLANRSAAFYHLDKFALALSDMDEAAANNYPRRLMHKLEERRARCHLALKRHSRACESFKRTLQHLDHSELPQQRKQQIVLDVRVMIAVLEKGRRLHQGEGDEWDVPVAEDHSSKLELLRRQMGARNEAYPAFSSAVEIVEGDEKVGRHGLARRDIAPGEILAVEDPHCSVLLKEYRLTHCHKCQMTIEAPLPASCYACTSIAYCGSKCRNVDQDVHKVECQLLGPLWCSGASVTCIMALKAVIQRPFEQVMALKGRLALNVSKEDPYLGQDYRTFHNLVTHESERIADDLFHRAFMVAWLLRLLKTTEYVPEKFRTEDAPGAKLSEAELFLAELMFHNLQSLQFNSHEISELKKRRSESTLTSAKSMFIGGGVFPSAALLNHSCNPSVIRYFVGTTMIMQSIRTIYKGAEISDNYGAVFTETAENERRRKMRVQYWFDCQCEACREHWPLLSDIDPTILRFKCQTGPQCGNVLLVKSDTKDFLFSCKKCKKSTNILGGLKTLQETDSLFDQATEKLEKGQHKQSLRLYLKILNLLDQVLALPMKDYHVCQQGIRLCTLALGNVAVNQ